MNFQKFNEYVNEAATYTDKYADLTLSILQTMAQNKMLHWGTTSYAQHKTFCDFMEEFDALGDSLIESIMGKFGRPLTGGASIEVLDYNQVDVIAYFDNLYEYYTAAIDQFQPKEQNEEIVNILAEIIALIDKAKYLLTLNEQDSSVTRVNEGKLSREELEKVLHGKYAIRFVRNTEDFDGQKGGLWLSAENGDLMPTSASDEIFNYYHGGSKYPGGVHKDFAKFLNKNGWYATFNDPGTVMLWPNN
jgi:hypothetical protein